MNLGLYSYLGATVVYGFFAILLLFSWRASLQGKLLTITMFTSAAWSALAASIAFSGTGLIEAYKVFEVLRYIAWYVFLLKLFYTALEKSDGYRKFVNSVLPLSVGFAVLILVEGVSGLSNSPIPALIGHIFLALIGLAIIEQLYRNTSVKHRWAIKYLLIGTGGIFAFDFYFYTDTLLFRGVDQGLWETRGIIHIVAVPLVAISSARSKNWSLNVFVSRDVVFNTTAILFGGVYLLIMAGAGYYLREVGGSWGEAVQLIFFTLAVAMLASVLFSGQLRARLKVFLGKHFYKNKYDYRVEWLQLTEQLSGEKEGDDRYRSAIEALAETVEARSGMLWLRDDQSNFINKSSWNTVRINTKVHSDESLVRYLQDKRFIINLNELSSRPDEYEGLELPAWIASIDHAWLIIPLFGTGRLIGFTVLSDPLVNRSINWEDRDLLNTAARQVTGYLITLTTSEALAEAKQFEVFSRLSAFMVHDLKNIAAELELVANNSKKHKNNPSFIQDAFETVDNAANDIEKLLEQLRNKRVHKEKKTVLDLGVLLQNVVDSRQSQLPRPTLTILCSTCLVATEKGRLANVLTHLIDNAQQATEKDGSIDITLTDTDSQQVIEIKDNGIGMDADFIRNRLFKPFDTTKGNAGMGIGMYESREFLRSLGGEIFVNSAFGKGTTILIHIPSYTSAERRAETNA